MAQSTESSNTGGIEHVTLMIKNVDIQSDFPHLNKIESGLGTYV